MRLLSVVILAVALTSLAHARDDALGRARAAFEGRDYTAAYDAASALAATDKTGEAAYILSVIEGEGFGVVPADPAKATDRMHQAAGRGFPKALTALGMAYFEGNGVNRDLAQAKAYWLKAAAKNDPGAIYNLGFLAHRVNHDGKEAVTWLRRAADSGNVNALKDLAEIFEQGKSVPANPGEAASYMRRAAIAGDSGALQKMVEYYVNGTGVPRDHARAEMWALLAEKKGDGISPEGRSILNGYLTDALRAEAARLLALCEAQPQTACQ